MKLELQQLRALAKAAENKPAQLAKIARDIAKFNAPDEALALATKAAEQAPNDAEIADTLATLRFESVPKWHFGIVRDEVRNDAYERALRRVVTPGSRVLEIGTGSGILAMMAARAGAACVYTCECNPQVAAFARKVIARNGFADRVHVVEKHSDDVTVEDIGGLADVLVSEIVSYDLLQENALAVMADVVPRLVRPGGAVIPYDGSVRIALVDDIHPRLAPLGTISGFDLSPFNPLRHANYSVSGSDAHRLVLRSDAVDLFTFDFTGRPYRPERATRQLVARGGRVSGIVQWMRIGMDETASYENTPGTVPGSCWKLTVYSWAEPLDLPAGTTITVHGRHDCQMPHLWVERPKFAGEKD